MGHNSLFQSTYCKRMGYNMSHTEHTTVSSIDCTGCNIGSSSACIIAAILPCKGSQAYTFWGSFTHSHLDLTCLRLLPLSVITLNI